MGLQVTYFARPSGRREVLIAHEIEEDDAHWFRTRSVKVSMESDGGNGYILYADYGKVEEGEPVEVIVFSGERSCRASMTELRELTERAMVS